MHEDFATDLMKHNTRSSIKRVTEARKPEKDKIKNLFMANSPNKISVGSLSQVDESGA